MCSGKWKEYIPKCGEVSERIAYLNVQGYVQGVYLNVQKYVEGVDIQMCRSMWKELMFKFAEVCGRS
jgi:hypothetical protein